MKKIITYVSFDGKSFDNEIDCEKYERQLKESKMLKMQEKAIS